MPSPIGNDATAEQLIAELEQLDLNRDNKAAKKLTKAAHTPAGKQNKHKDHPTTVARVESDVKGRQPTRQLRSGDKPHAPEQVPAAEKPVQKVPAPKPAKQGAQQGNLSSSRPTRQGRGAPARSTHQAAYDGTSEAVVQSRDIKQYVLPVPRPSVQYIHQATEPVVQVAKPRRLFIVLDLNGTLVYRKTHKAKSSFLTRPYLKQFLEYATTEHDVMVWSSARKHNVDRLCNAIFDQVGIPRPRHCWDRRHFSLSEAHFEMRIQVYKQLSWIWADRDIEADYDRMYDPLNQSNTILIDDSVEKASSEPYNLLEIVDFDGQDMQTDVLGKIVEYLEQARRTQDVSSFMRRHPFKFNAREPIFDWGTVSKEKDQLEGG